ncbi:MetQ/NlpA family ABC transporter substrate-binding protein [Helicobacter mustelae]|uniref:Putative outer membrane lipoprotein n=1 Tax=Helicobacter mustelae (strain ATCC 43772 / CCUG 25715 / CIP 103759 / LMG 18044 / NCTC 12198 / R85-136P) TaxID=679897 RepID=D3UJH1_HELM1|nr:MetQ/NlpA family ABC transporter substrate-binding protein [Helicobacter mustelae]CBG40647.1 putative outer membrane lipoprotein [Helicobacter mustelae 12198]SQH72145.1 ABC transporter substrate-binding protein [Helicobacter mustelae]STP13290.1 ABC transporter substrate-binding protein [Helicobacter mustelae]
MKSFYKILFTVFSIAFLLGCKNSDKEHVIIIGASPVPHAQILEHVKPELKKLGYDLQIRSYTDYVTPNEALLDGSLDANFFQHVPFLEAFNKSRKSDLQSAGKVHIEPLSIYSAQIKNLDELKENDAILIPNDPSNLARALILLDSLNVIKLKDPSNLNTTEQDIIENPKNLKIVPLEAALLADNLHDKKARAIVINGNYALQKGLKDPIAQEGEKSPYANVIATQKKNVNSPKIQALLKALHSKDTRDFILKQYKGEVIPVF